MSVERMRSESDGVWMAYYADWSGFTLFADEISALRHAVDNHTLVMHVAFGQDPREVAS